MSTALEWFKSSYSGDEGGNCLEVAYQWRKSSYSTGEAGSNCVEVGYDWTKSSYSTEEGGNCLEVAAHQTAVHIRDSKIPDGPVLTITPTTWATFTTHAARTA